MSVFPSLLWVFLACGHPVEFKEHSDPKELKGQLLRLLPPSSELEAAKGTLVQMGFQCGTERSSEFPGATSSEVICDRLRDDGIWTPVRWQIALLFADGKVTDVQVSPGMVGP